MRALVTVLLLVAFSTLPTLAGAIKPLSRVGAIAQGADKAIWFSLPDSASLVFIAPGGCAYFVNVAVRGNRPNLIAVDKMGTVWFNLEASGQIGYISEHRVHYIPLPGVPHASTMLVAPDGTLWILPLVGSEALQIDNSRSEKRVRFATSQQVVTDASFFPDGRLALVAGRSLLIMDTHSGRAIETIALSFIPRHIQVADGSIWFIDVDGRRVGRYSRESGLRYYTLPSSWNPGRAMFPGPGFLVGSGNVYVGGVGGVYRIRKDFSAQQWLPAAVRGPISALTIADGDLWFGSDTGETGFWRSGSDAAQSLSLSNAITHSLFSCASAVPYEWLRN